MELPNRGGGPGSGGKGSALHQSGDWTFRVPLCQSGLPANAECGFCRAGLAQMDGLRS